MSHCVRRAEPPNRCSYDWRVRRRFLGCVSLRNKSKQFAGGALLGNESNGEVCVRTAISRFYVATDAHSPVGAASDARKVSEGDSKLAGSVLSNTTNCLVLPST
jgi:hypothetical protein